MNTDPPTASDRAHAVFSILFILTVLAGIALATGHKLF